MHEVWQRLHRREDAIRVDLALGVTETQDAGK
jgi:hypothetical protein